MFILMRMRLYLIRKCQPPPGWRAVGLCQAAGMPHDTSIQDQEPCDNRGCILTSADRRAHRPITRLINAGGPSMPTINGPHATRT